MESLTGRLKGSIKVMPTPHAHCFKQCISVLAVCIPLQLIGTGDDRRFIEVQRRYTAFLASIEVGKVTGNQTGI